MKSHLLKAGYVFDGETEVWCRPGFGGIAYSDGDEVERRIATIVSEANDRSILSQELRQHCTDWPSLYHLTGVRANILRPFQAALTGDILEVGAGCGAITRYLGECGANVLALEGTPRRAAIARERTRELNNVAVVTDKFENFRFDKCFDVITLIGVLEYANQFNSGFESPPLAMLEKVRSLLKPDGRLILAIENQLGLKYFAGAPEDHLGQVMYGVEGRYRKDEPETYGRKVIGELLRESGFVSTAFLAPFPDYKLPVVILTQEGAEASDFDAAELVCQCVRKDPQLPERTFFSLEQTWPSIFRNGLGIDLANSHLIVASPGPTESLFGPECLAFYYNAERRSEFCKEAAFVRSGTSEIAVRSKPLSDKAVSETYAADGLSFEWQKDSRYIQATTLAREFGEIVTRPRWRMNDVEGYFQKYLRVVLEIVASEYDEYDTSGQTRIVPGEFLDAIPSNILLDQTGKPVYIDREWRNNNGVPLDYLLFRAIISLLDSISSFAAPEDPECRTRGSIVNSVMKALGFTPTEEDFARFLALESKLHSFSSGRTGEGFSTWSPEQSLPGPVTPQDVGKLQDLLAETMSAKEFAEELAYARQAELLEQHAELTARQTELAAIRSSWWYRVFNKVRLFQGSGGADA